MKLVDNPEAPVLVPAGGVPRGAATDLAGEAVIAQRRHQVTDILPAPAPEVSEHVAQAKRCPWCGAVTEGELPAQVRARASYGPEAHAQAANLTCGNHVPGAGRAGGLMAEMAGMTVSAGLGRRGPGEGCRAGGVQRVHGPGERPAAGGGGGARGRDPGPRCRRDAVRAPGLHAVADAHAHRGPVRGRGQRRRRAARLHRGSLSGTAITRDTATSPPPCSLVRGAPARDLKDLYEFEPGKQDWARQMAGLLDRGPRRGPGSPRGGKEGPRPGCSWATWWAGTGRIAAAGPGRERLPAHRDREGRPAGRPPVHQPRGHDPAVHDPPRPGHLHQ